jgi:predicted RNA-binding protein associated with RNAse of E/G family
MKEIELVAIRPGKREQVWINELVYADASLVISMFDFSGLERDFVVNGNTVIERRCTAWCADLIGKTYEIMGVFNAYKKLNGYYININRPIVRDGNRVIVYDLFLDIWVFPDMRFVILDEDEFKDARAKGLLTAEDVHIALDTLKMLTAMIESGGFKDVVSGLEEKIATHRKI